MWYDGSFLKLNGTMQIKWLRAAGDNICVLISSYSEMAEDQNTASVDQKINKEKIF